MKKLLLNHLIVFSLLFSSLPITKSYAFMGPGVGKMANVVLNYAIGLSAAYKLYVCKAPSTIPVAMWNRSFSFYMFNSAAVLYWLSEEFLTKGDGEDAKEIVASAQSGERQEQANAYKRAAEVSYKNAKNSDKKSLNRKVVAAVMIAAAAVAVTEHLRYESLMELYPQLIKGQCLHTKAVDAHLFCMQSATIQAKAAATPGSVASGLLYGPSIMSLATGPCLAATGLATVGIGTVTGVLATIQGLRFATSKIKPSTPPAGLITASGVMGKNGMAITGAADGCVTEIAGLRAAAAASVAGAALITKATALTEACPGVAATGTAAAAAGTAYSKISLMQRTLSDTTAKLAYTELSNEIYPAFKMVCGVESAATFTAGMGVFNGGSALSCTSYVGMPPLAPPGLAPFATTAVKTNAANEAKSDAMGTMKQTIMIELIQKAMGAAFGGAGKKGSPGFLEAAISVAMIVKQVMAGSTMEYLPLTRAAVYGMMGAKTLLSALGEADDAKEYRERGDHYMALYRQLNNKANIIAGEGEPCFIPGKDPGFEELSSNCDDGSKDPATQGDGGSGPTVRITAAGGPKKSGIGGGPGVANITSGECFFLNRDGVEESDNCACKKDGSCGELNTPTPDGNSFNFGISASGAGTLRGIATDSKKLLNARLSGDRGGQNKAFTKISKNLNAVRKVHKEALDRLSEFYKKRGKKVPDLDKRGNAFLKNIADMAKLSVEKMPGMSGELKQEMSRGLDGILNAQSGKKRDVGKLYKLSRFPDIKFKARGAPRNNVFDDFESSEKRAPANNVDEIADEKDMSDIMNKKYKMSAINKNKGGNLFKILSHRYFKSAVKRLK